MAAAVSCLHSPPKDAESRNVKPPWDTGIAEVVSEVIDAGA